MDGTATISLDTLDELREKAEEARLATNRSKKFTSKLMDCYEFDTEKYNKAEAEDNREKILKFIVKYIKRHCYPPATYEIAADTGLSKATVRRHIAMLLEDRILETEHPGDSRAYRIKDTKIVMVKEKKTNGNDNSK